MRRKEKNQQRKEKRKKGKPKTLLIEDEMK